MAHSRLRCKDQRDHASLSALRRMEDGSMKKEELEAILGNGSDELDLGPIEDSLHVVATERKLPVLALGQCTIRIEESSPVLLALLKRAADGATLAEDENMLLFR